MSIVEEDALEIAKIAAMFAGGLKQVDSVTLARTSDRDSANLLNPERIYREMKAKLHNSMVAPQPPHTSSTGSVLPPLEPIIDTVKPLEPLTMPINSTPIPYPAIKDIPLPDPVSTALIETLASIKKWFDNQNTWFEQDILKKPATPAPKSVRSSSKPVKPVGPANKVIKG